MDHKPIEEVVVQLFNVGGKSGTDALIKAP